MKWGEYQSARLMLTIHIGWLYSPNKNTRLFSTPNRQLTGLFHSMKQQTHQGFCQCSTIADPPLNSIPSGEIRSTFPAWDLCITQTSPDLLPHNCSDSDSESSFLNQGMQVSARSASWSAPGMGEGRVQWSSADTGVHPEFANASLCNSVSHSRLHGNPQILSFCNRFPPSWE